MRNLFFRKKPAEVLRGEIGSMPIEYRRRHNARRYILRVNAAGNGGCVTIPRGGSLAEARSFAERNARWLEDRLRRQKEAKEQANDNGLILFRGEALPLVELATRLSLRDPQDRHSDTLAPTGGEGWGEGAAIIQIKRALLHLAQKELPPRVTELARQHGLNVRRVSVRNQRSRWGSCSARGVVSLNWRLVQTPEFVRDYIIVHELMHLREMNHSSRYWKLVYDAFPRTDEAEKWLKKHARLLRNGV